MPGCSSGELDALYVHEWTSYRPRRPRAGADNSWAMPVKLREVRDTLTRELRVYRLILKHERTPRMTRWLLGAAVAYALSPIDLIPDWLPIVGHLDDVLIVPLLVWLSLRFVPAEVVSECRTRAGESDCGG